MKNGTIQVTKASHLTHFTKQMSKAKTRAIVGVITCRLITGII